MWIQPKCFDDHKARIRLQCIGGGKREDEGGMNCPRKCCTESSMFLPELLVVGLRLCRLGV